MSVLAAYNRVLHSPALTPGLAQAIATPSMAWCARFAEGSDLARALLALELLKVQPLCPSESAREEMLLTSPRRDTVLVNLHMHRIPNFLGTFSIPPGPMLHAITASIANNKRSRAFRAAEIERRIHSVALRLDFRNRQAAIAAYKGAFDELVASGHSAASAELMAKTRADELFAPRNAQLMARAKSLSQVANPGLRQGVDHLIAEFLAKNLEGCVAQAKRLAALSAPTEAAKGAHLPGVTVVPAYRSRIRP